MPIHPVLLVNYILLGIGTLLLLGYGIHLAWSGRWRDPLAGVTFHCHGPDFVTMLAVGVVFVLVPSLALSIACPGADPRAAPPGSHVWHLSEAALSGSHALVALLAGTLWIAARRGRTRDTRTSWRRAAGLAVGGFLLLLPVMTALESAGRYLLVWLGYAPTVHPVLQSLPESEWGTAGLLQVWGSALLIAPLTEELLFRGLLMQAILHHLRRPWLAIVASAALFGAAHQEVQAIVPLFTMGIVLGYVRVRTDALWPCVLLHVLFNARTMATATLLPELVLSP